MAKNKKTTILYTRALLQPDTLDEETREIDVVFATETPVERCGWDENYNEVLVCEPSAVRMDRANKGLPVLDCHSFYSVFSQLGKTVKVWFSDTREVCARIRLSKRQQVEDLFNDIKDGIVTDISVGYRVYKYERTEPEGTELPVYRALDWMPYEISFAPVPADINSGVRSQQEQQEFEVQIINRTTKKRVSMKKGKGTRSESEDPKNTVEYTIGDTSVKEGDKITLEDGTEGVALSDGEPGDVIELELINETEGGEGDEARTNEDDEEENGGDGSRSAKPKAGDDKRLNAILTSTRAAGLSDTYAIELHQSKRSIAECRQAIIEKKAKATTPVDGTHNVRVGEEAINKKRSAIESVLLTRINSRQFKATPGANEYRGMTLIELGKELLQERGISTRGKSKNEIAAMVFARTHGTSDFPLIFEGIIDKQLRAEYEYMQEFWDKIARSTTVADFREKSMYQFTTANGMKEVKEGSELKYTTVLEGKESIRVKSFGEGIKYTRQAFVNDDLSALERIPGKFRKDWDLLRGDLIWGLITDNVKMGDGKNLFSTDHNNLLAGANSKLSETGLIEAQTKFRRQTDVDGKTPIRVLPRFLVVPPELEVPARKLIADTTPVSTQDKNVFANAFEVLVEARLTDTTAWYLAADPYAIDSLYYANLEGEEDLRVNTEHDFDTDSMKFAVRGDFGAAAIDHRGLLKANGK
ncbi:Mu-like prophage major head subunit gpT family protein [Paludibacteraceae bacterium OttesenSCG-928-F17]|nr:Mu-like prophage major head subunit gpT family protein [Paludibacteraceae bacterium OttesenSCG-928-F17]